MKNKQCRGFTLIELMVVVAIVAILSSVAFGYYGRQVVSSKRTDGRAAMTETATSLEKCKALYSTYNNVNCNVAFPVTSTEGYYTVTAVFNPAAVGSATQFLLTAVPLGSQMRDLECTSMTLTNTGIKGGAGAIPAECW